MQTIHPKFTKTEAWIAAITAVVVALIIPLGYFTVCYQHHIGALEVESEADAHLVSHVIKANPDTWRSQQLHLKEFLQRRSRHNYPETRRIFDDGGTLIAESAGPISPPLLIKSAAVMDPSRRAGRIEISRSLQPLILTTGGIFLLSSALAGAMLFMLRSW